MDHDGDSDIIDLGEYRRKRPEARRSAFAVWGGDGERSRFALPVWRAVYLVGGERGALVWVDDGADPGKGLNPFFVLDLASESPRTEFNPDLLGEVRTGAGTGPVLSESLPGGAAVFLGAGEHRRWFLVVDDGGLPRQAMDGTARNDLLFLAGECAGLLLHRRLDQHPSEPTAPSEEWGSLDLDDWDYGGPSEEAETEPDGRTGESVEGEHGGEEGEEPPEPTGGGGRGHLRPI